MELNKQIGADIERRRRMLEIPRTTLAAAIGVSNSAMARIEKGQRQMTVDLLCKIAQQFGVAGWYLLLNVEANSVDES